jgi:hypothetical protein
MLFLLSNCAKKTYTATTLPPDQLSFGEGGGFTGAVKEYCLLKNGQIFQKKSFTQNLTPYKRVKKKVAKKLFKTCDKIGIEKINLNHPGDKYFFIEWHADTIKHRIIWGGQGKKASKELSNLYLALKNLTQ